MTIYNDITEIIGGTPLVYIKKLAAGAPVAVKLERQNPAGSCKDRAALFMIEDAERSGQLKPGAVIIEPTSGNTGIGLAAIAAVRGYRTVFTMPETMSPERVTLLRAYGAEVILTDGDKGMAGAIEKAEQLCRQTEGAFMPRQFENPSNPHAHECTTGPEIWQDTDGKIDIFVAGVGTGGTISGIGRYLKSKNAGIKVVAVEPEGSPILSGGAAGAHGLQGIGAGFVPKILDTGIYDEIVTVSDQDAFETAARLADREGILCGITSGAAVFAAIALSKRPCNAGKLIVALLPDTGERYLSSAAFIK